MSGNDFIEKTLWQAADKLRNNLDAAEYKHVVLGLIFLKYISDAFNDLYRKLSAEQTTSGADPEDKDEYLAERVFYVPKSFMIELPKNHFLCIKNLFVYLIPVIGSILLTMILF